MVPLLEEEAAVRGRVLMVREKVYCMGKVPVATVLGVTVGEGGYLGSHCGHGRQLLNLVEFSTGLPTNREIVILLSILFFMTAS